MTEFGSRGSEKTKIMDLKPEMNNLQVVVRVIEANEPKVINTRIGQRTISEAIVGDETGRVKLTLWGKAAGSLQEGQVVEIKGAWTTTFRGDVQLNIGGKGNITEVSSDEVPEAENIPEESPKAPEGYRPSRRGTYPRRSYGSYGRRYGSGRGFRNE